MREVVRDSRDSKPMVVSPDMLAKPPEDQTPGIERLRAFGADDRWVGYVRTSPGEWSGWHHHGETDTYLYVVAGRLEFEYGLGHERFSVGPGDFAFVPANTAHRERTMPGQAGEIVLIRMGLGPTVFPARDPGTE